MKIQPFLERTLRSSLDAIRATAASAAQLIRRTAPIAAGGIRRGALAVFHSPLLRAILRPVPVVARIAVVAALARTGATAALRAMTQTITPTEIGVLQRDWGQGAGIQSDPIGPSKRMVIPGLSTLHRLDRRIQFVRFGLESEGNEEAPLELHTADDLEVRIGATVPYRIIPDQAHALVADGLRSTYHELAKAASRRVLLEVLGELGRDDWSSGASRSQAAELAATRIAAAFEEFHLESLGVHFSSTWFPPEFEAEIMEQKLLEQRILTDAMLARRDERAHELATVKEEIQSAEDARTAELDFAIQEERLQLTQEVEVTKSEIAAYTHARSIEADNRHDKAVTEGRLALDQAEALRERLVNEALESDGGRVMIAREAAENLQFRTVKLDANHPDVPSVLDLDVLVELLLGE
ncbi:MAG: SPFH domain-containing protein [Planctomycetota bacterium]